MPTILDYCTELPQRELSAGDTLITEGGKDNILFILIDGALEVLKGDVTLNVVDEPGAIFGEVSVLLGIPHMATVKALSPARVFVSDSADAFLRSNKDVAHHVATLLAQRLQGVTNYLVDIKRQYEDRADHLGMVDEVLESLVHQQNEECTPGSDRDPNTAI